MSLLSICISQRLGAYFFKCLLYMCLYMYLFLMNGNGCGFLDVYVCLSPWHNCACLCSFFSLTNNFTSLYFCHDEWEETLVQLEFRIRFTDAKFQVLFFWNCKHILSSLVNNLVFLKELCSSYVIYEDLVHAKISLNKWLHNLKLVLCLTILIVKIFHYMTILCYFFIFYFVHSAIYFRNNFSWFSDVLWSLFNVLNSYSRSFLWLLTNPCMFFFA